MGAARGGLAVGLDAVAVVVLPHRVDADEEVCDRRGDRVEGRLRRLQRLNLDLGSRGSRALIS